MAGRVSLRIQLVCLTLMIALRDEFRCEDEVDTRKVINRHSAVPGERLFFVMLPFT